MSAPLRARTLPAPTGVAAAPDRRPQTRSPLRLVDDARVQRAARQRRARRMVAAAAVAAGLALLALAGSHAFLVTNQVRIDELQRRVDDAQAHHQALRLQVATLEAPDRIVSVARDDLGMVRPETVTYLRPGAEAPPDPQPPSERAAPPDQGGNPAPSWGTVKPYLGRDA